MNGKSKNLIFQVERLFKLNNMKSIKTRYRYREACYRFCNYLGENTNIKKFTNIKAKNVYDYLEYMRSKDYSPGTIKLELSAIRFFYAIADGKNILPTNEKLKLEKRITRGARRAWSQEEIEAAIALAKEMGRMDVVKAILLSSRFGCRLEEAVVLTNHQIKESICSGFLYMENTKGKNPREVEVRAKDRETLKYILSNAKSQDRIFIGIGDKTHKVKRSIQNWITNHREEFQNGDRVDRDTARKMLEEDKKSAPKTNLTMHGNRHSFAQLKFDEALEKHTENEAKRKTVEDLGHHRVESANIYLAR